MAAKLLLLILFAGATAASLLVIRHERIETAYEISRSHRQAMQRQRTLWALRWTIAERCRPEEIQRLMDDVAGEWTAIRRSDAPEAVEAPRHARALVVPAAGGPGE